MLTNYLQASLCNAGLLAALPLIRELQNRVQQSGKARFQIFAAQNVAVLNTLFDGVNQPRLP